MHIDLKLITIMIIDYYVLLLIIHCCYYTTDEIRYNYGSRYRITTLRYGVITLRQLFLTRTVQ